MLQSKLGVYFEKTEAYFKRYKKYAPVLLFFGGFTWDGLTLTRIDRIIDNIILLSYFLVAGIFILLVTLIDRDRIRKRLLLKYRNWYPLGLQFAFGALFSAYVVFYFKSAALTKNWLFFGVLVVLLVANEFLENRLNNLVLVFSLYFLAAFSFFIFFIPVVAKRMDVLTFMIGGILSLMFILGYVYLLYRKALAISKKEGVRIVLPTVVLFLLLNLFYSLNWIPPVPLSLKSGAIYRRVVKVEDGYRLSFEKPKWYQFWKDSDDPFRYAEGDSVFCFASIFAPALLRKNMFHHWQQYFPNRKEWLTTDRIGYEITGGRYGGYRGYSYKKNLGAGKWRVDVETEEGQLLGRIGFEIEPVSSKVVDVKTVFR
jgi:hypothetical protein